MLIKVTQEDIDKGTQEAISYCPVALAVKRQTGGTMVRVLAECIEFWIGVGTQQQRYCAEETSTRTERFIKRFDKRGHSAVKPFAFRLKG